MASKKHHRFFEECYFPMNLIKEKCDIYHVPQNGMGLDESISCKKVVTIHDLIPYVMPETVGKGYLLRFLKDLPRIIELSDCILTVSEWSKKDILKFFPIDEKKIVVTPLAADSIYRPLDKEKCKALLKEKYNINKPFILYIGGFSARKNVKALIIAFSEIRKKLNVEHDLVIVGANKDDFNCLMELSANIDICSNIVFTGYVPSQELPILYNGCELFAYPSLYEGFGLPPLEAMSCGTPVITSNISSIPEVVKDAGILIDPFNIYELMDSMLKVLNDDKEKALLSQKGLERSKDFSWKNTAQKTLEAYKNLVTPLE